MSKSLQKSANEAVKTIADAAGQAVKTIADAANQASRVVSNNASTAAAVVSSSQGNDHDLLTRLEENVGINFKQVKDAIKELSDGTSTKINDHESRLKIIENKVVQIFTFGTAGLIVLGIAEYVLKSWK